MAPVTGPRNPSGDKTGTNRRTADARFSTTGGISPDSPQSRSAGLRDQSLYLAHHAGDPAHGAKPTDRRHSTLPPKVFGHPVAARSPSISRTTRATRRTVPSSNCFKGP